MASDHIRASDSDRDAVVATLREAFSEGRLTLEEFQERTTAAYAGRTWGDLRELTTDLPVQPTLGADLPPGSPVPDPQAPQSQAGQQSAPVPGTPYPPFANHPAFPLPGQPALPGQPPFAGQPLYPGQPPYPFQPPAQQQRPGQPVPGQNGTNGMPPASRDRGRGLSPVLPIVGMWILFALATHSADGAVIFIIAMAAIVMLSSIGRRPPRGPSDGPR